MSPLSSLHFPRQFNVSYDASTSIWPIYSISYKVSSLTSLSVHKSLFTARIDPVIYQYLFRNVSNFESLGARKLVHGTTYSSWAGLVCLIVLYDRLTHKLDFYNIWLTWDASSERYQTSVVAPGFMQWFGSCGDLIVLV